GGSDADECRSEISLVGNISLGDNHFGAKLLGGVYEIIAARAPPIGVEMQDGELLEAQMAYGIARQQRLLIRLANGGAPHEVSPLCEIRMRVGEAELHEARPLIDR